MITNAHELFVTLHQLTGFTDMLDALHLDAESQNNYKTFSQLSPGYFQKVRELNSEIRDYLQAHPDAVELTLPQSAAAVKSEAA